MDTKVLSGLIDTVPEQTGVFSADLAAAAARNATSKPPEDEAFDGTAHYVYNMLRAPQPSQLEQAGIPDATLDDVRAILVARGAPVDVAAVLAGLTVAKA